MRILRVLRHFSRLNGLDRLCQALGYAIWPLCNAIFALIVCSAMRSIFGAHYFRLKASIFVTLGHQCSPCSKLSPAMVGQISLRCGWDKLDTTRRILRFGYLEYLKLSLTARLRYCTTTVRITYKQEISSLLVYLSRASFRSSSLSLSLSPVSSRGLPQKGKCTES